MTGGAYSDDSEERWDILERETKEGHPGKLDKQLIDDLRTEYNGMQDLLARIPRQVYYDHKYPQVPIIYTGVNPEDGSASVDVRSFLTNSFETRELDLSPSMPEDFIALLMRQWVADNITWVNDKSKHGLQERWMYPSETMSARGNRT